MADSAELHKEATLAVFGRETDRRYAAAHDTTLADITLACFTTFTMLTYRDFLLETYHVLVG